MGFRLLDQYSLLHAAVGVVLYFWGVPLLWALMLHTLYEWAENTLWGMRAIRRVALWPGGKSEADALINVVGDTISVLVGWGAAAWLDHAGKMHGWYFS